MSLNIHTTSPRSFSLKKMSLQAVTSLIALCESANERLKKNSYASDNFGNLKVYGPPKQTTFVDSFIVQNSLRCPMRNLRLHLYIAVCTINLSNSKLCATMNSASLHKSQKRSKARSMSTPYCEHNSRVI